MNYADHLSTPTPQSKPLNERQVPNNAGGYVFQIDDWARLDRFLILGAETNTYYQKAKDLVIENAGAVKRLLDVDPARVVARAVQVSTAGRAPKNDPAIFVLALAAAHADVQVRSLAYGALPGVCRTSTHLFTFVETARSLGRGWGRGLKRAVARWYEQMDVDKLAYQVVKYRSRGNYTHNRLLDVTHPKAAESDADRIAVYRWICGKEVDPAALPSIIRGHEAAMASKDAGEVAKLITEHRLPWEAVPTEVTKDPRIWHAMLPTMGTTALIRNLAKMTAHGALKPMTNELRLVTDRLTDVKALRRDRVHPFAILLALATYRSGRGDRGSLTWDPIPQVIDALDKAFYEAFAAIEPSGKRTLIGLDVSGSMDISKLFGSSIAAREGAAAMVMATARVEPNYHVMAFSQGFVPLEITPRMRLDDVVKETRHLPFDRTDCAQPMLYALEKGLEVDVFQIYTDNETWVGKEHPVAALQRYRQKTGIPAKLAVVGMTSTGFSIADPDDAGMMDFVGFDSAAPAILADFARG